MSRPDDAVSDPGRSLPAPPPAEAATDRSGDAAITDGAEQPPESSLLVEYREALEPEPETEDAAPTPDREWAWVTRWRQEAEPTPWGPGLVLAVFTAVLVAVAILVLTQGLADLVLLAVLINVVVAAGLAPAIWMVRDIPVIRWIGAGMALGLVAGWCAALAVLPAVAV